jgi:hypothetical protein
MWVSVTRSSLPRPERAIESAWTHGEKSLLPESMIGAHFISGKKEEIEKNCGSANHRSLSLNTDVWTCSAVIFFGKHFFKKGNLHDTNNLSRIC